MITVSPLFNRIGSVIVHVSDLRRSVQWYSLVLGLPLEEKCLGGEVYWFDLQGTGLLLDAKRNKQTVFNEGERRPLLMYPCEDIDAAHAHVQERAEILEEPQWEPGAAHFHFRDPEGRVHMACWSLFGGMGKGWLLPQADSPVLARIGAVFVNVRDIRGMAAWHSELLGVPLLRLESEEAVYSVPVSTGAELLLDNHRFRQGDSFEIQFMLQTPDIDAAWEYAAELGVTFFGELERHGALSFFVMSDPDGHLIMVGQLHSKKNHADQGDGVQ